MKYLNATSKRLWPCCECVFTTILPTCYVLCVTSNRMHFRTIPFHSFLTFSFLGDCCCRWKSAFTCGGSLKTFFFLFCFWQNYSNFWKNCLKKRLNGGLNQHRVPFYVGEAAKLCSITIFKLLHSHCLSDFCQWCQLCSSLSAYNMKIAKISVPFFICFAGWKEMRPIKD